MRDNTTTWVDVVFIITYLRGNEKEKIAMFMLNVIISAVGCLGLYLILIKLLGNNVTLMKIVGVAVCDLTPEEHDELAGYIDDVIAEAIENGLDDIEITYEELCLSMFTERVEDELEVVLEQTKNYIKGIEFLEDRVYLKF